MLKRLKQQIRMRANAPRKKAPKNDLIHLLREIDALNLSAARPRTSLTALKDGARRSAKAALDMFICLKAATYGRIFSDKANDEAAWLEPRTWWRDWVVFGVCLLFGVGISVALIGSLSSQSTSNMKTSSNSEVSHAGPVGKTASVKTQDQATVYVVGLVDAAKETLPKPEKPQVTAEANSARTNQLPSAAKEPPKLQRAVVKTDIHTHAIGDVLILKQDFVGCRNSWENDGLLELENKLPANECGVRLPAGTAVIVANTRADNNICLRFPEDIICYWTTDDVLKPLKLAAPPREGRSAKAKPAKVHSAATGSPDAQQLTDDDQLKFLFDR